MSAPPAGSGATQPDGRGSTLVEAVELASKIWLEASGCAVDPRRVEVIKKAKKSKVFRLPAVRAGEPAIIAKIRRGSEIEAEVYFHRHVAHTMPIRVPELLFTVDFGRDTWMFYQDAGRCAYNPESVTDQRALTSWLAAVHGLTPSLSASGLPHRDADHYLGHLESAQRSLTTALDRGEVPVAEQPPLRALSRLLDGLRANWSLLAQRCERAPRTLVHGDLVPKNIMMSSDVGLARPLVLDWEMAGWGVASPDLAAGAVGARIRLDQYLRDSRDLFAGWSVSELRTFALTGTAFRYLAAADWAARGLAYPPAKKSIRYLTSYSKALADTVLRCGVPGVVRSPK